MPKISVIIPLYNAENFIEPCLQSLLEQTFDDFEVIIVDDASTDHSVELVESMAPKFDGRLSLVKRTQNSGGIVAIPRNIGLDLARGDYIAFVDNDDLLIPTALETLHKLALDTNSDVLNASNFYRLRGDAREIVSFEKRPPVETVTTLDDNLGNRVEDFIRFRFHYNVWTKFFSRRFLVEHQIRFPQLPAADDMLFSFCCLMRAERYVRIPDAFYVWRHRDESVSHETLSPEQEVHKRLSIVLGGCRYLDEFARRTEFLTQNPRYRFAIMSLLTQEHLNLMRRAYNGLSFYDVHELIRAELDRQPPDNVAALGNLISIVNVLQFRLKDAQTQIEQLIQRPPASNSKGGKSRAR